MPNDPNGAAAEGAPGFQTSDSASDDIVRLCEFGLVAIMTVSPVGTKALAFWMAVEPRAGAATHARSVGERFKSDLAYARAAANYLHAVGRVFQSTAPQTFPVAA